MKRNISELLDGLPVDDIELQNTSLLSTRRIKEKTMGRIGAKKTVKFHWMSRVAVVVAVIMAMTLTAFAADNVVSDESVGKMFEDFFGKPLSKKQEEIVHEIGTTGGDSTTNYGVTITPIAAMADDTLLYLQLRIEAPKGTVLPDVTDDGYYQFGSLGTHIESGLGYSGMGQSSYWIESPKPLPDSDPYDNTKEFMVTAHCSGAMKFTDGVSKKLVFKTLWYHSENKNHKSLHEPKSNCCSKLLDGDFEVSFNIAYKGNKLDLPTEKLVLYNEEFDFTTTVDKLIITPLSVTREYTATTPNDSDIFPTGGSVEIIMKDGTSIKVGEFSEYNFGVDEEFMRKSENEKVTGLNLTNLVGVATQFKFEEPIVLEDIDYIVYGGEHIIDVN